jgi:hypothetical protein
MRKPSSAVIGRVGALAVFLGVGVALGTPAVAHADTDTDSAPAASQPSKAKPHRATAPTATKPPRTATGTQRASADVKRPATRQAASPTNVVSYTLFNRTPTTDYRAQANTQADNGVVSGSLRATDSDGDRLTYRVVEAPTRGSVVLHDDGTFDYVPTTELAQAGGTDSFVVSADDSRGNPFHLHLDNLTAPGFGSTATCQVDVTVAPSPTAPSEQLQLEALAAQLASSPRLDPLKDVLRVAWVALASLKYLPSGGLHPDNLARVDQAIDEFTFGVAMRVVNTDAARPEVLTYEIPPHERDGVLIPGGRWAYDNPDTIYRTIPVNAASSYVITGRFAGDPPTDVNFSVYTDANVTTPVANLAAKDLVVQPDGSFTITVDADPAGGRVNHLQLTTDASQIFVRDTLGDWSQTAVGLSITRTDGPDTPPQSYGQLLDDATSLMVSSGLGLYALMLLPIGTQTNALPAPGSIAGTLVTQRQSQAMFRLDDNQAMVITLTKGDAGYFVVPVTDAWTITPDYRDHQSSLNSEQAVANSDGTYTVVLSPTDPGVANWVDTAGLHQGTVFIRWQLPGTHPTAGAPTVSSQIVDLADLDTVLPPNTIRLTPAQRAQQLAQRRADYDARLD